MEIMMHNELQEEKTIMYSILYILQSMLCTLGH